MWCFQLCYYCSGDALNRNGALDKESYTEDTYPTLMKRFVSFRNEMSVILVLWHDCQQLIERYNEEQVSHFCVHVCHISGHFFTCIDWESVSCCLILCPWEGVSCSFILYLWEGVSRSFILYPWGGVSFSFILH